MSQNPVLPEENSETVIPTPRKGRKPKAASAETAPEAAEAAEGTEGADAPAEKKPVRRRKTKAESTDAVASEEAKPRRTRTRKAKAEESAEAAQEPPAAESAAPEAAPENAPEAVPAEEAPKPRRGRTRKAKPAEKIAASEAQVEPVQELPAAESASSEAVEQDTKEVRKSARRRKSQNAGAAPAEDVPAAVAEPAEPAQEGKAELPVEAAPVENAPAESAPVDAVPAEKKEKAKPARASRTSRKERKPRVSSVAGAPDYDSALDDEDEHIVHLGSAVVLDDMLPPSALRESQDEQEEQAAPAAERPNRTGRKGRQQKHHTEPGNQAAAPQPPVDDDLGNRAEGPAPAAPVSDAQPAWFDDGIVTNILPYPGEFGDDLRSHRRINTKKGRRGRDAQPLFNGSPYLPAPYQQEFYGQPPFFPEAGQGNRKDKRGKKNRRDNKVPTLPAEFDFNAAMLNDSVLGAAFAPREDELFPEDDGPQPVLSDQPAALPLSSADMAEEELEALDAAVNGNRIDGPARAPQKEERKGKKGKKNAKEEKPVREEKKAKAEAAPAEAKVRRVLYISAVPDEQVEVVITEDGLVTEYFVEMAHQVKIRGNIYKGIINNIDTNLQAAFVNFGNGKNGFLQIDEVHPEYYLVPHDASNGPKYPPIQKVLKVGQEVLVQVVKEPAGTKGAFLTTWISIAGRFLVLTPGQEQIGVSRKVEDPEERARLKELLNDIQPGENMGVIIRTASEGVSRASIQQDLQLLQKLWREIQKKAPTEKSPSLIYQEADLATRSVRDYLSEDIEEIWTDDEATKARVEEIAGVIFPDRAGEIVKLHKEQRQTLWERFGLLKQLESVTSREVILPSGGRLVFDQTEALMAIDINSGKTQGKTNFEAMVFRTNMEAAEAIARHLRLRDIGGQVVIDFIEMRDKSHCREVERAVRNAMRKDRARHDVGHMSSFGLLELVRQRTGTSAISITTEPCPHCHGTGVRRNMEWQALQAMRDLQAKLCKSLDAGKTKKGDKVEPSVFAYETDAELALYILNRKRDRIAALEEKFGVRIEIRLK